MPAPDPVAPSAEAAFIDRLRTIATHPAARGLMDDAALFVPPPGRVLVLTHDMLVEGVHYLPDDPPEDVAWKLVAVNLSDLAAKGARGEALLLGYTLGPDPAWDAAFVRGLGAAVAHHDIALLGGDTVAARGPRTLGLTAIGSVAPGGAPVRAGARPGDDLWVTGRIGDAGAGLAIALQGGGGTGGAEAALLAAYRRPVAQMAAGQALIPLAHASADVSDGLLIDAGRMASASGCAVAIAIDRLPLSAALVALAGASRDARLTAATAGDDYQLIVAIPPERRDVFRAAAAGAGVVVTRIGGFAAGRGLSLTDGGVAVPLPARTGYQHGATRAMPDP